MKIILLLSLFISFNSFSARYVVETSRSLTTENISVSRLKVEPFAAFSNKMVGHLYVIEASNKKEIYKNISDVKSIEAESKISAFSVLPADNSLKLVTDELFPYQWGLLNQGQTFLREKDDIRLAKIQGEKNKDIGWDALVKELNQDKKIIVAVLDSGVDANHPDLVNNIWKNEKECGLDPKVDHDNNKLPGDCSGWNFTENLDSDDARNPNDLDGHGTHVAGIIAASLNNMGIVGVAPSAVIMPIKVMKDSNSKSSVASSIAFARGIIYATDMGAKVINMSLGWPRALETKHLRDSVQYAINQGVIIVAAAGNNNSSEPIYPCAYDGVLCVGATTLDGKFAGFSNYGGYVDTLAPGDGIVSTIPTELEPSFFEFPGYDVKSGTSQAAPFVSGLVASLMMKYQDISFNNIFARFYQLNRNDDPKKYALGGDARWQNLNKEIESPILIPVLKRVRQILLKGRQQLSKISIPVRNYGLASSDFQIKLEVMGEGIEVLNPVFEAAPLNSNQFRDHFFDVKINDLSKESNIRIKVSIINNGIENTYYNDMIILRDILSDTDFKKMPVSFEGVQRPLGDIREGQVVSFISTINSYETSKRHEFYLARRFQDADKKSKTETVIFSRQGDKFNQKKNILVFEDVVGTVNVIRIDLNRDNKEDYFFQHVIEKDGKKYFRFSFYNENLNDLWPKFQHVIYEVDTYIANLSDVKFVIYKHSVLGSMLVPTFFSEGMLPVDMQKKSSWDKADQSKKNRVYYLEPTIDFKFKLSTFTHNEWEEKIKSKLKMKWYETITVEQILPVTNTDAQTGAIRVVVSVGQNTKRSFFIYRLSSISSVNGKALPQILLQTEDIDPIYSLTNNGLEVTGDLYFNIYDRTRSRLILTNNLEQKREYIYRHDDDRDIIAGHLATFSTDEVETSIIQTREKLITLKYNNGSLASKTTRPKLRYSFLTQKVLSEMYYPVMYKRDGISRPALYVDATAVSGNRASLFEEQDGKLVSSIQNSIQIPGACKALNPQFNVEAGTYEYIFVCWIENTWSIFSYPMN